MNADERGWEFEQEATERTESEEQVKCDIYRGGERSPNGDRSGLVSLVGKVRFCLRFLCLLLFLAEYLRLKAFQAIIAHKGWQNRHYFAFPGSTLPSQ